MHLFNQDGLVTWLFGLHIRFFISVISVHKNMNENTEKWDKRGFYHNFNLCPTNQSKKSKVAINQCSIGRERFILTMKA